MNRKILLAGVLAAVPAAMHAQEYKLVNCRTLEAAGNFVGSDEVLNGEMVCQRVKAGASLPATNDAAKPLPGAVISGGEAMNVVEAAKVNAKKAEPAKDGGAGQGPAEAKPEAPPVAAVTPATATAAVSAAPPSSTSVSLEAPSTPVAAPPQIHRDAPVAEGTPSAPPEKDYGFSDANAVDPPKAAVVTSAQDNTTERNSSDQNAARAVQLGAFGRPSPEASDADPQAHSTNVLPGETDGFQEGQRVGCTKNVTLGSVRDDKLVLGTPPWARKWVEKNQKRLAKICFSATPMRGAQNYLIVFYTVAGSGEASNALPAPEGPDSGDVGGFTTRYGSTWHYVVDRKVGTTELAKDVADEPQTAQPTWYATAYAEDGTPVAERWPERGNSAKHENVEHASEELLSVMVEDLRKLWWAKVENRK